MLPFRAMSATSEAPAAFRTAATLPGPWSLLSTAISEVTSRRRLVRYLVQADMKKRGSDTVLGNLWWILDPLLQMVVYVVFVTILTRGRSIEDYPLFILAAILPWKWFSAVVGDATGTVVSRAQLIKQIAFPKIVLPVATATAGVVGFAWSLIPLAAMIVFFYDEKLSPQLAWIPVIAVVQYVFTLAVAILVSAANVFFRDLGNVVGHVLRLWWFLSPGLYSLAALDELEIFRHHPTLKLLANMNPFAILFESYRNVIYGPAHGGAPIPPNFGALAALLVASFGLVALAMIVFKRLEPNYAKVL